MSWDEFLLPLLLAGYLLADRRMSMSARSVAPRVGVLAMLVSLMRGPRTDP